MKTAKKSENAVKKHSAAIQIEGNITLLQRKTWNVLLWHAYDELPTKDIHHIPTSKAMQHVGYDSHDDEYFKASLKALSGIQAEWNILDKDGSMDWGFAVLLASANIKDGICSYGFAPHLRQKLYNPDMYARLDIDLQKRFGSKYALAVWELCTDYLGAKRDHGETPWISIEDFRKVMGLERGDYPRFDNLKARVITPAVTEVNEVSDFRITVEYQNKGRKITALKFKIRRVALLPEPANTQAQLFPELDDMPQLVRELTAAGLSTQDAFEIWQQGFGFVEAGARPKDAGDDAEDAFLCYVREKIHLLKRRQASGKIENATGFLREAIRKNYVNPEYAEEQRKGQRLAAHKASAVEKKKREALADKKAALERQMEKELHALCNAIIQENPGMIDEAAEWALDNVKGFRFAYKVSKTAEENYRDSPAVQGLLNPYLERQYPTGFRDLRDRYDAMLAALEQA